MSITFKDIIKHDDDELELLYHHSKILALSTWMRAQDDNVLQRAADVVNDMTSTFNKLHRKYCNALHDNMRLHTMLIDAQMKIKELETIMKTYESL